jgi:hypothetical protein
MFKEDIYLSVKEPVKREIYVEILSVSTRCTARVKSKNVKDLKELRLLSNGTFLYNVNLIIVIQKL